MWEMGRKKMNRTMMKTKRLKSIDFSGNSFIIQGFGVILLFHSETAGRQLSYGIPGYLLKNFASGRDAFAFG